MRLVDPAAGITRKMVAYTDFAEEIPREAAGMTRA
jgi:hypothetical protein